MNSNIEKIVVICPGGAATGGVELLHQLVDGLTELGCNAAICYYPFFKKYTIPMQYQRYNCPVVKYSEINRISAQIVLPEVYGYLSNNFEGSNIYFWWMSVDNYINSGSWKFAVKNFFPPWRYLQIGSHDFSANICGHLCQSEYAKLYLEGFGIKNSIYLSDYINAQYLECGESIDYTKKENIVAYNPAKGIAQTEAILPLLQGLETVPIVGMSRDEVMQLLGRAKVYIDFGNHPGKDRIPREAAALGCCVVTNRRGSAGNAIDIPIDDGYKIDDTRDGFEALAAEKISQIIENFDEHKINYDLYRVKIAHERDSFKNSVASLKPLLEQRSKLG